jgi:dUTP pyrophosphatase
MSNAPRVVFEPLHADVSVPVRATEGAVGYDVRAHVRGREIDAYLGSAPTRIEAEGDVLVLPPGVRAAIPLGFRARLPPGVEAQLRLRSSIAFRRGLVMPNAPATIDPDYPGEWLVLVSNALEEPVEIRHLERIAQIVFARVETPDFVPGRVGVSSDRTGGVGSTGAHELPTSRPDAGPPGAAPGPQDA